MKQLNERARGPRATRLLDGCEDQKLFRNGFSGWMRQAGVNELDDSRDSCPLGVLAIHWRACVRVTYTYSKSLAAKSADHEISCQSRGR